jgi:hypothetical protein
LRSKLNTRPTGDSHAALLAVVSDSGQKPLALKGQHARSANFYDAQARNVFDVIDWSEDQASLPFDV